VTTARLSDFWKQNLHVVFGQRNVETARRADQPICALSLKDGPNIVWVQRRSDLTQACKTGADYIFSAQTAYYPCASNTQIHAFRLRPNERHLIWFNNGRVTQASNYDNIRPLAWHMPYQ